MKGATININERRSHGMTNLVIIKQGDVFTDSMVIAEGTGNAYESVVSLIKKYPADFTRLGAVELTDLKSGKRGRPTKVYRMNEMQATLLISYMDNTEVVREFKIRLVEQFFAMRQLLLQKQSPIWQDTRSLSKQIRKKETDTIKIFVEYAQANGSSNAMRYYTSLSRLADKAAGIPEGHRDVSTVNQLNTLCMVENIIERCILDGIGQQLYYKEVYQACKDRLMQFSSIAYLAG